jgi:hypothetical protein
MYFWLRESAKLLKAYLAVGFAFGVWGILFGYAHVRGPLTEQEALLGACVLGFAAAQLLWNRINRPAVMVFVSQARTIEPVLPSWGVPVACVPVLTFTFYLAFVSPVQTEVPSKIISSAGAKNVSIAPINLND